MTSQNQPIDPNASSSDLTIRAAMAATLAAGLVAGDSGLTGSDDAAEYNEVAETAVRLTDALIARLNLPYVTVTATTMPPDAP